VKFEHPSRGTSAQAMQGQVLLYLGPNPDGFQQAFKDVGIVAELAEPDDEEPGGADASTELTELEKQQQHRQRYDQWAADPHNWFLQASEWLDVIHNAIGSLEAAEDVTGLSAADAAELNSAIRAAEDRLRQYRTRKGLESVA
jgi:hypothetical protein